MSMQPAATVPQNGVFGAISDYIRNGEVLLAVGILAILVVLLLPLPPILLDLALSFSITFSILILMTAIFIKKPLEFSSFPTVLLISTMLRVALNLAAARLSAGDPASLAAAAAMTTTRNLVGRTVSDVERDLILDTLDHCLGNRTHAANILGISIRTLRNKLRDYSQSGIRVAQPGEARIAG